MTSDADKSPCAGCVIHLRRLNKKDPRYPCGECAVRIAYADRNYGMPARLFEEDTYFLYADGIDNFYIYKDGLKITDIGG